MSKLSKRDWQDIVARIIEPTTFKQIDRGDFYPADYQRRMHSRARVANRKAKLIVETLLENKDG